MRQKEKRRNRKTLETADNLIKLAAERRNPGSPHFVSICSAECMLCGCEFDPVLYKDKCPSCGK